MIAKCVKFTDGNNVHCLLKSMQSHAAQRAFIQEYLHFHALPMQYHDDMIKIICTFTSDLNLPESEFCRLLFPDPRCRFFSDFSQTEIAEFLGLSFVLVTGCKQQVQEVISTEVKKE
jgi:hypothetical protein